MPTARSDTKTVPTAEILPEPCEAAGVETAISKELPTNFGYSAVPESGCERNKPGRFAMLTAILRGSRVNTLRPGRGIEARHDKLDDEHIEQRRLEGKAALNSARN
jgi:hypothetical protein